MVAPWSRYSATLLFKWTVTDRYEPAGKKTVPPPEAAAASIVLSIAGVSIVLPSPVAPKTRTLKPKVVDGWAAAARRCCCFVRCAVTGSTKAPIASDDKTKHASRNDLRIVIG